jgi:hypothetical protein
MNERMDELMTELAHQQATMKKITNIKVENSITKLIRPYKLCILHQESQKLYIYVTS